MENIKIQEGFAWIQSSNDSWTIGQFDPRNGLWYVPGFDQGVRPKQIGPAIKAWKGVSRCQSEGY